MKFCLFAGTFNPIHKAHLAMAEYVLDNFGFDKIIFIPAYKPPHKSYDDNMSMHRFEMVKLATKNNPKFEASDIEFKREGKSYTYLTILEILKAKKLKNMSLRGECGAFDVAIAKSSDNDEITTSHSSNTPRNDINNPLSFIIGTDAFRQIETWYETDKLKKLIDFIVFIRENETVNFDYLKEKGYNFQFANMNFIDISSTELRERIKNQESITDLVTKEVEEYIYKNGLYKN